MQSIHTRIAAQAARPVARALPRIQRAHLSTGVTPAQPRHLFSIADLTATELTTLVRNARAHKLIQYNLRAGGDVTNPIQGALAGQTIAVTFSKRSTRTRVSTEGAVALMGGHPMFLGKDDIQLGVNESLRDTSIIISSMCAGIVARVHAHSDVTGLAEYSTVPVINALSDLAHPLQTIADYLTIHETFLASATSPSPDQPGLGVEGLKVAWVGDANNVLFDLALAGAKLGVHTAVATPKGFEMPRMIQDQFHEAAATSPTPGTLSHTNVPEEAVKDADVIVTDTWVSMGQETEKAARLKAFECFMVTEELARRGGAKEGWKFMHCLPRKEHEVDDEVFYGPRSLVFPEGENRLWSAVSTLHSFVTNKGII